MPYISAKKPNPGNAFCVLLQAQQYEKILVDQCWEVIDRETEEAVKSEEFPTIERSLLEEIVKRASLIIREIKLQYKTITTVCEITIEGGTCTQSGPIILDCVTKFSRVIGARKCSLG